MVERSQFEERTEHISESFEASAEAIANRLEWLGEVPIPVPSFPISGLYEANIAANSTTGTSGESRSSFLTGADQDSGMLGQNVSSKEELRLDVDRFYPQMTVSGTIHRFLTSQTNWVAGLKQTSPKSWSGSIWYKDGDTTFFPYTSVEIKAVGGSIPRNRAAIVKFSTPDGITMTRTYNFKTPYFRKVDFEFDYAEGEIPTTGINTCEHPNHPVNLPCENMSIEQAYKRSGFDVTVTQGGMVPIANAHENRLWSDAEMHDAMKAYWSRFAGKSQWAMWVFFAALHEMGESLGGIMFDDIGPNHRQGTAIFNDSFISKAPPNDPNPNAWAMRMIFWTACHEMGHAFNLAHSWQKSLGASWIPLADEPEARSFMNYPYRVRNGEKAFFADFEYRF
ncbi:MAG: hypothetical protein HY779_00280, partial [Rubrobacteridae bacterium]|nr:hypothetical protein [Rubrobacteridae bacterium]